MDKDLMNEDELFFDQMKDQFVSFYVITVLGMELVKYFKAKQQNKDKQPS